MNRRDALGRRSSEPAGRARQERAVHARKIAVPIAGWCDEYPHKSFTETVAGN